MKAKAIVVRQPWAWAICCLDPAWKDVENRTWRRGYRGPVVLLAAAARRPRYETWAADFIERIAGIKPPANLARGGIVGAAMLRGISESSESRWYIPGHYSWEFSARATLPFRALKGRLGLFDVELTAAERKVVRQLCPS